MDTLAPKEQSPTPSGHGIKGVLIKARRGFKDNVSSTSVNGTTTSSGDPSIRSSLDSQTELGNPSRVSSIDNGAPSSGKKLSKLIPGLEKRKRKKREKAEQAEQGEEVEDEPRGRTVGDQTATTTTSSTGTGNESQVTLGEDGTSSLVTEDSIIDSPITSPPPLQSHDSHIGYLTSSSPLIQTENFKDPPHISQLDEPNFQDPQYDRSTTLPINNNSSTTPANTTLKHASTLDILQSRAGSFADAKNGRGVSPGARIRDAFVPATRKKEPSPPMSPDYTSITSGGSVTTLGSLFGKGDKRNSINLRRGSKVSDLPAPTSEPSRSNKDLPSIATRPKTPTSASSEAPLTTVTPPTPTEPKADAATGPLPNMQLNYPAGTNANTVISPSGNMISHRRVRSDSSAPGPSKLSNAIAPPLTPTVEEGRTPGGGARTPGSQSLASGTGGFFSSVFSVAQNAATTLQNTIANNPPRPRSSTQTLSEALPEEAEAPAADLTDTEVEEEKKELAIDTIGSGDLSLSHLGITDSPATIKSISTVPANGVVDGTKRESVIYRGEAAARVEDASAARAVSAAYSEKLPDEVLGTPVAEDPTSKPKTRSVYESTIGDKTPPNGSIMENDSGIRRSGSVRSRVGAVTRRHRNSSTATAGTATTIAAAIGAGHSALAHPTASLSSPKLTGFAVASKKRNRDFHQLFRSVPEDDFLIEDYSCALQREIILAGRMYISEGHICFSSNILGWVTTLIISFDEIVSVEKESTAVVFPNAIAIQTLHARQTFRSLLSREATYELIIGIWRLSHPTLKSYVNGMRLEQGGTGDKTEKIDSNGSDELDDLSEDDDEVYDEDADGDEGSGSIIDAGEIDGAEPLEKSITRKASAMGASIGAAAGGVPTPSDAKGAERAAAASTATADYPGPTTHAPTECSDHDTHYENVVKDEIIPAPLGKVYSMVFGPTSGGFMTRWFLDDQKMMDLQMEDDKKGLSDEVRSRSYSYIKPLYAAIGPKQTKCIITENLDAIDLEKAVSVTVTTQTPDVPSGNAFSTKTKFCMMWASGNATRLLISCKTEWTGKSWLKGPIEKGATDGQTTYANDLARALKAGVTAKARLVSNGSRLVKKGKRRRGEVETSTKSIDGNISRSAIIQRKAEDWGLLEPIHPFLGPIVDIFSPLISANVIIGVLVLLLVTTWFRGSSRSPRSTQMSLSSLTSPERIAAYEEIWRQEENDLWDWLEERVGMQSLAYPRSTETDRESLSKARMQRGNTLNAKSFKAKMADQAMNKREIDRAIRVTEEKLKIWKEVVERREIENSDEGSTSSGSETPE